MLAISQDKRSVGMHDLPEAEVLIPEHDLVTIEAGNYYCLECGFYIWYKDIIPGEVIEGSQHTKMLPQRPQTQTENPVQKAQASQDSGEKNKERRRGRNGNLSVSILRRLASN